MLQIRNLTAGYGPLTVLRNTSLEVAAGEVCCLMGRNGAGKTTLLRALMGQADRQGDIRLGGVQLADLPPHEVARQGIGYVPQGRRLFGPLSVAENLQIGLMARQSPPETLERVLTLFPRLRERMDQASATLSGGEQQMLAIGRALCLNPSVLLLDEPTEGLQPSMIALIRDVVAKLRDEGVAILLVEHRVDAVLALADRIAFVSGATIAEVAQTRDLTPNSPEFRHHLGV